ncbi:MAG: HAD family phosphatase [Nanoarchaeota archaeon]
MKAVIFDRDGVILDSESTNVNAAVMAFKELGIAIKEEEKEWIVGRHPDDYIKSFLEKYDFSYEEFRKIQSKRYHELFETTPLFEKTIFLIKKLHKMKIPLALTTSSSKKGTLNLLHRTKLEDVFNVVVTFEDYKRRKPDPESYIITAKKLGLDPKDCVVIEDSIVGVEAAKNAGMKCIAIPNEYTKKYDFSIADLVVDSADEIDLDMLNAL